MSLSELLREVGDENIEFQILHNCISGSQKQRKGFCEITFATPSTSLIDLVSSEREKIAFVVWLPQAKVDEIRLRESKK